MLTTATATGIKNESLTTQHYTMKCEKTHLIIEQYEMTQPIIDQFTTAQHKVGKIQNIGE